MDIIWTSSGHHLDTILTSFGHHLDIIWTSFGHRFHIAWTSVRFYLDIIWTSFAHHLDIIRPPFGYHLDIIQLSFGHNYGIIWTSFSYHLDISFCETPFFTRNPKFRFRNSIFRPGFSWKCREIQESNFVISNPARAKNKVPREIIFLQSSKYDYNVHGRIRLQACSDQHAWYRTICLIRLT